MLVIYCALCALYNGFYAVSSIRKQNFTAAFGASLLVCASIALGIAAVLLL